MPHLAAMAAAGPDAINLGTAAPATLDGLPLDKLFGAIVSEESDGRGLSQTVLEKLDRVYQVKVVRLLASPHNVRVDLVRLDDHLGRVACDDVTTKVVGRDAYVARWRYLRDLLATAMTIRELEHDVASQASEAIKKEAWEYVAKRLLQAGPDGLPWKVLSAEVAQLTSVSSSKASLSVLLGQLCSAGWVDARVVGREKHLWPGARISASQAYKELVQMSKSQDSGARARRTQGEDSKWGDAVELLRQYVCFSQGRLIEHFHLINSKHKDIRLALAKPANERVQSTKLAIERYLGYLNEEFEFVAKATFNKLAEHFEHRGTTGTRVRTCLKGNWTDGSVCVADIVRDSRVDYVSSPINVNANAGFAQVSSTGTYFLANDLPEMSLKGQYWNPRLDPNKLAKLRDKLRSKKPDGELSMNYEQWIGCWVDGDSKSIPADTARFYRSTLIIPCTIWNNSLSDGFLQSIRKQVPEIGSFDRIILGYLCLDHVDKDFFDASLDVKVGFVMADMLSIFLFARWLLTQASATYKSARNLVDAVDAELRLHATHIRRTEDTPSATQRSRSIAFDTDRLLLNLQKHERHYEESTY